MGRKLLAGILVLAGVSLALLGGQLQNRLSQASFSPGLETTMPPAETLAEQTGVVLPCLLQDGGLVAEELIAYEGPYVEDGSCLPVTDVAALMIYNGGERDISSAMVTVEQSGKRLHFFLTWLPAGGRVLVLEYGRTAYSPDSIMSCESTAVRWESFEGDGIRVWDRQEDRLAVRNESGVGRSDVRLRYKSYVPEGGFYLGGITYCAYIGDLASGEEKLVKSDRYATGLSQVVAVLAAN